LIEFRESELGLDSSSNAAEPRARLVSALGFDSKQVFRAEGFARRRKMRMKLNKSGQLLLVSAASLLGATLIAACGTLTVDFVFVTSSKAAGTDSYGEVDVFEINSESGAMRQIPTSPFPSGGRNPVAEAVSSDLTNLYVVNQDDNSIVQFIIGNDGKLYPQNTTNTPGIYPLAVTVSGKNLFVVDTYQPLPACSTAAPCSGSIAVYPITPSSSNPPSDALGSPVSNGSLNYWPLSQPSSPNDVIQPTGISTVTWTLNSETATYVYVTAKDTTANTGYVFGFTVGSGGVLTPLSGSPFAAGTNPSAVATTTTTTINSSGVITVNVYAYITDSTKGDVVGLLSKSTLDSSGKNTIPTGSLTPLPGSPFPAGDQPSAIVVDPSYSYAYVTNLQDSTITAYSMNNGALTSLGTYATGSQPVAIGIDPSTNHFLYTANYFGNGVSGSLSGFELSPTAGTLVDSQSSPYTANALPTAVAAIPHNGTGAGIQK